LAGGGLIESRCERDFGAWHRLIVGLLLPGAIFFSPAMVSSPSPTPSLRFFRIWVLRVRDLRQRVPWHRKPTGALDTSSGILRKWDVACGKSFRSS